MDHSRDFPFHPPDNDIQPQRPIPREIAARHSPSSSSSAAAAAANAFSASDDEPAGNPAKRPRGRPRKYPLPSSSETNVPIRSKTGCQACRAVKKKCDEARPVCGRCRANRFECKFPSSAGSPNDPPRQALAHGDTPSYTLGAEADSEDSPVDRLLWQHVEGALSRSLGNVLCKDSLSESVLQMARSGSPASLGLRHALLWLSAIHLSDSNTASPEIETRSMLHYDIAIKTLREKIEAHGDQNLAGDAELDDHGVAQTLVLGLKSLMKGQADEQYTMHLVGLRNVLASKNQEWPSTPFRKCVLDFYTYQEAAYSFTALGKYTLPEPGFFRSLDSSKTMTGAMKEMFVCHFRTCALRQELRQRRRSGLAPIMDPKLLAEANSIGDALDAWEPPGVPESAEHLYFLISQACGRVYLLRTATSSKPTLDLETAVGTSISLLQKLRSSDGKISIALLPVFILGVAAFDASQRAAIYSLLESIKQPALPRATDQATDILHYLWELMDERSEESWDWEAVIKENMGLNFLLS